MIAVVRLRDGCVMAWHTGLKRAEKSLLAFGEGFELQERTCPYATFLEIRRLERL